MSRRVLTVTGLAFGLWLAAFPAAAQEDQETQEEMSAQVMHEVAAADLTWGPAEVPGFLPGLEIAAVHGDPSVADGPYTLRLRFPDGYAFPPHWHPRAENVTVLEGTFHLAMGESFDEGALQTYGPGDYLFIEGENAHFGKVTGTTVLQLHGVGPFAITVVEGQEMAQ